jgi:hypothetical protein
VLRSLGFDAREIGLEEVTGGEIAHQRDLDVIGIVERCRHVLRPGRSHLNGQRGGCSGEAGKKGQCFSA